MRALTVVGVGLREWLAIEEGHHLEGKRGVLVLIMTKDLATSHRSS